MKKFLISLFAIVLAVGTLRGQMYVNGDFSNNSLPSGWQNIDADGDGYKWVFKDGFAWSYSWYNSALTPNNWLITPEIDLTNATAGTNLNYYVAIYDSQYPAEHYQVRLSTTSSSTADFTEILLDETLTAANASFKSRKISLDNYIGQKVYIAFVHNNCTDKYAMIIAEPQVVGSHEIAVYSLSTPKYATLNSEVTVSGYVLNVGSAPMTSFDVAYNVNGVDVAAETVSGLNVACGDTAFFAHSVKIPADAIGELNLTVSISSNDSELDSKDNNEEQMTIIVYDRHVSRHVLVEQFTTANCGNCPNATQQLKNVMNGRTDVCWIAHHAGYYTDGLTHSASANALLGFYNAGGSTYAPAMMLNRQVLEEGASTPVFSTYDITKKMLDVCAAEPTFVTINISDATYNSSTRELSVTIEGEIVRNVVPYASDLRLSLYFKEDNLKTTPGQSGSSLGTNYIHNNVMRANISNVWGDNNIITSNTAGTTYSHTYTYTVPSNFNVENCAIVAFVSKYNGSLLRRDVLNAKGVSLTEIINGALPANDVIESVSGIAEQPKNEDSRLFSVYPNPAKNNIHIKSDFEIQRIDILNIAGQLVKSVNGDANTVSVSELSDGLYFVRCVTENGTSVKKFVKE